jgi:oligopeptide/dipeptide ABC transporter ATP-binding protein
MLIGLEQSFKTSKSEKVDVVANESNQKTPLLSVKDIGIAFDTEKGRFKAVDGVSFDVYSGRTHAIVGESGCGKSVSALATMGLLPQVGHVVNGSIEFNGQSILNKSKGEMRKLRGNDIAMIFQEPMTALNPVYTVGQQISEVFKIHQNLSNADARKASIKMLEKVRIPDPLKRIDEYPFQLSGGMRQRVLIAIALACNPKVLIADEPTTALDVTIQLQILNLMKDLQKDLGTAIILITHDLGVVAEMADDVTVMYAGKVIESGSVFDVFETPTHPYTKGLLRAIPRITDSRDVKLSTIEGLVPSIFNQPKGCRFHNRCGDVMEGCSQKAPELKPISAGHDVACFLTGGK